MIVPVILSGGSGTRLWPLSRAMYPKQFLHFFNGEGSSLLGATLARLRAADSFEAPIIVCNNDHRFLVQEEVAKAGIEAASHHPGADRPQHGGRRGRRRALRASARSRRGAGGDAVRSRRWGTRPASSTASSARPQIAATGRLVLFGIKPAEAHTGYGYIRQGAPLDRDSGGFAVEAFCEKPERARRGAVPGRRRLLLEQRHLRLERAHVPGGAAAPRSAHLRSGARRAGQGHRGPGLPAARYHAPSPPRPTSPSTTP